MRSRAAALAAVLSFCLFVPARPAPARGAGLQEHVAAAPGDAERRLESYAGLPDRDVPFLATIVVAPGPAAVPPAAGPGAAGPVSREIDRLAARLRPAVADRRDPGRVVAALTRFVFEEEGFAYDPAPGDTENYLPGRVLARRRGNCLGLTVVCLALAERLGLPLRAVYVPSHCFLRYEDRGVRINIETAANGAAWDDARYAQLFGVTEGRPYLGTLGTKETIGVYLKSLGAAWSRAGRDDEALALYRTASLYSPGLPDVAYNAGISYQKTGRLDQAIAQYRRALALDPDLAAARDNLGVALARKGRYREALDEALWAVKLDPRNVVSRGNLAATLCACGMTEEGIREFEKVLALDPGNPRALTGLSRARRLIPRSASGSPPTSVP